jgi:DNA topoisomerase I
MSLAMRSWPGHEGSPVRSITLFALGGVAAIEKDAADAKTEFWMSIACPLTSIGIGALCTGLAMALGFGSLWIALIGWFLFELPVRMKGVRPSMNGTVIVDEQPRRRKLSLRRNNEKLARHTEASTAVLDPVRSAKAAGLRYTNDTAPGITRQTNGKSCHYRDAGGEAVTDPGTLGRIKSLAIPPAWRDVWICPFEQGHVQATGLDAKGRKQYRYHSRWREVRDETKYDRMLVFAKVLPKIRERVELDLSKPGLPREKILATVVRLLETTLIRVGNEEYARQNESFGLTTMRDRHVDVSGATLKFAFRGKSGITHAIDLTDRRLAKIVKQSQDLPGYELFQYIDEDGAGRSIDASDVNAYLKETGGEDFTAKDFRTWAGTVLAARALQEFQAFDSQAQAKRNVVQAIESVAKRLGNTKAVCRKCYIHPAVITQYMDGALLQTLNRRVKKEFTQSLHRLSPEEAAVLTLLQQRLKREAQGVNGARQRKGSLSRLLRQSLKRKAVNR